MTTIESTQKNRRTVLKLMIAAVLMFGFGFALVPFYNLLCKATGLNGKTNNVVVVNQTKTVDTNRVVTVQFVSTANANLPWDFYPLVKEIKIHPGENEKMAYYAKNNSGRTMTVQAVPSVTPGFAAKYLNKTECFCFTQQTFKAGEAKEMPLLFHLDKSLPDNVKVLTLSYTMFDAKNVKSSSSKTQGKIN
jgi:cytochrome c oxidase assembly protein subunit 11